MRTLVSSASTGAYESYDVVGPSYDTAFGALGGETFSTDDSSKSYEPPHPLLRQALRMREARPRAQSEVGARAAAHNAGERTQAGVEGDRGGESA
jgi:hypothetical protein